MARSYRILAELLELALRAGYKLPIPVLPVNVAGRLSIAGGTSPAPPNDVRIPGLNPSNILQHPGYYYYAAASCTQQRYERFLTVLEQEVLLALRYIVVQGS